MRTLTRNKRLFWYATYVDRQPVKTEDEYGNEIETGEYETRYGDLIRCAGNISPASGVTATEIFGTADGYDKIIVLDDPATPIDEHSILWLDTQPVVDGRSCPHDFIVKRVAKSLNTVAIACRKVTVDG